MTASGRTLRRRAVAAAAAAAALAGCGGSNGDGEREPRDAARAATAAAQPVGEASGGSVAQYADCDDWRAGTAAERRATVVELRRQLTPQTSRTAASPLPDERAFELLERSCSLEWAGSLRLAKLYVSAQGFAPLAE